MMSVYCDNGAKEIRGKNVSLYLSVGNIIAIASNLFMFLVNLRKKTQEEKLYGYRHGERK